VRGLLGVAIGGAELFALLCLEPGAVERLLIGALLVTFGVALLVGEWLAKIRVVVGVASLLCGIGMIFSMGFMGW